MQFNLVNDQEQVAQFVWRGVPLHCVAFALGFISILGVCLQRFLVCACVICMWGFSVASYGSSSGSFAYYACAFAYPHGFAWLSVWCVGARVLSSISLPSSPYSGCQGPSLM